MLSKVQRFMLWGAVGLLAASALLVVLSVLPDRWFETPPEPPRPLALELIEPAGAGAARPTRGMSVGQSGFGNVLSAPGRRLEPSPSPVPPGEPTLAGKPAVSAEVAGLVRLVPRLAPVPPSDRLVTFDLVEQAPEFGTIILRDGCLKLKVPGEPHAILAAGSRLYVDEEGYLAVGVLANGAATNPRLGEPAWWPGGNRPPVETEAVARIRSKCGPGGARIVGLAQSVSASRSAADGAAARNIVAMYGIRWAEALARVRACRAKLARNSGIDPGKMIDNPCGSTPPSPVADPRSCPAGTSLSGGLCRTPEGHIRPLPALGR
jgi:hypothetical protein